ncbi:phage tail tape measure protein [Streptomyces sp. TRM49041]|uniref:phage tail tape measure protein n=1 Tax=Streptomyces sp. TRM49041 TaxID=2603216 RepID=UPI0011EF4CC1|nr:phage tail tape measure protein [Streptomyces sp. TRM49041]
MTLTVAELLATIDVDDRQAERGLARAEANVVATAENITAEAARAGDRAGRQLGDGVADGAEEGGRDAGGRLRDTLRAFGWAALGATVGAALLGGVAKALDEQKGNSLLAAQLGADPAQAKRLGKAAGTLYSKGYTDSVADANEALKSLWQQGLVPADATQKELEKVGGRLSQVAQIMGEEVGPTSAAVGQMLKTGMARNAEEAFDILVKGTQNGANKAEDLLDVFGEYGTQFRDMGVDGKQAMGLIQQGLKAGARDADIVADAFKELNIRIKSGEAADGLKSIGLNADEMAAAFNKGGPAANAALDKLMDRLRAVKDPTERSRLAVELLGTQAEDLSGALFALDPSSAVKALGDVDGAAKKAGDTMRDNASTRVTEFTRSLEHAFVDVIGNVAIPALMTLFDWLGQLGSALVSAAGFVSEHSTAFTIAAAAITTLMLPALIGLAAQAYTTAVATVTSWATQTAAGITAAARFVATNAVILAGWVAQGVAAAGTALRVVGAWVLMGTQSLLQAARMAAAWLIAMGPVALIIAAVIGLVALIVANWDTIRDATLAAWNWIWEKIKWVGEKLVEFFLNFTLVGLIIKHWDSIKAGTLRVWDSVVAFVRSLPGKLVSFFLNFTLVGLIVKHWESIKTGTVRKAGEMLAWVRGLPRQIAGYFGNFGSMLYDKGKDLVKGLWNGIRGMGTWLKNQLISFAKNMIPGPIARALGIHSPSRVMARDIGRWIPAGVVEGIRSGQGEVDRTMRTLVPAPTMPGPVAAGAGAYGSPGAPGLGSTAGPMVRIEHWHAADTGTPEQNANALAWHMKTRG